MNMMPRKLLPAALFLSMAVTAAMPAVRAAGETGDKKNEHKAKPDAETLRRYDKNGDGKLDPDEQAAMRADENKAKAEKAKDKRSKEASPAGEKK
jgi:hypothetical protein